jgi:hypothetical protein
MKRFWEKVDQTSSCWEWTASRYHDGYGRFQLDGKSQSAHRVSWTLANGPIPDGECVLHTCDNPPCVRPSHLFLGTQQDNVDDMGAKGRKHDTSGAANPSAKITEEQARDIHRRASEGQPHKLIGKLHGLSRQQVGAIASGRHWK